MPLHYDNKFKKYVCFNPTATVEICSVGAGLVKIAGVETEFFLTIDDSGTLRATVSHYCHGPTFPLRFMVIVEK